MLHGRAHARMSLKGGGGSPPSTHNNGGSDPYQALMLQGGTSDGMGLLNSSRGTSG